MADGLLPQDRAAVTGLAAGDLNRQITIRKRAAGVDALNRPNGAWATFLTLWASPRGQTGMGTITAAEGVSSTLNRYSWRVRFRQDITLDMQLVYAGQEFAIVDIKQDFAEKNWTDLICVLGVAP